MSKLPKVEIADLLEAGIHFGHKAFRWNPKMAPYIYGVREGVHIIDLKQTAYLLKIALNEIYETVKRNGKILFVGTKVQATDIIEEYAQKCGQHYVNHRWLGGTLTNWHTVSKSIKTLENIEKRLGDEEYLEGVTKKEILELTRKKDKLLNSLGGIRNLGSKVDLIVIVDTNKENIAVKEARKLKIPIVGIVDTNSDPDFIDFPVPGNDDAIRSIRFFCSLFADAALAGIEEALSASGVDLGTMADNEAIAKNKSEVEKIKSVKKVFKFKGQEEASEDEEAEKEFAEALKEEGKKKVPAKKSETKEPEATGSTEELNAKKLTKKASEENIEKPAAKKAKAGKGDKE